ncbi:hypothetical protein ANN_09989 [Periplaneta americana]|uniref:Uncharacterized protein n=1 Tax=Periplaneta americana TaxID=6978 RepID=A0ABQ8TQU7_PERAM|nr:hypothetical protein ANN_09989 [Periplaneta americana]
MAGLYDVDGGGAAAAADDDDNLLVPPLVAITAATLSRMLSTSLCRISTGMRRHPPLALSWTMEVGLMFRRLLCSGMQTIMFTGWTGLDRVLISNPLSTFETSAIEVSGDAANFHCPTECHVARGTATHSSGYPAQTSGEHA